MTLSRPSFWLVCAAALLLSLSQALCADTVKIAGFWIPDVRVEEIASGSLRYTTTLGAEVVRSLADIQGLSLDAAPEMKAAHEALEAGNHNQALKQFLAARPKVRAAGLRAWIDFQLAAIYDKAGKPREAMLAYLELTGVNADPFFLASPPLKSAAALEEASKKELRPRVEAALKTARDAAALEGIKQVQALLGGGTQEQRQAAATAAADAQKRNVDLPDQPAVVLPKAVDSQKDDPIVRALWLGDFSQVLELTDKELASDTRRLSFILYLRGKAQLALADKSGLESDYKNSGLTFMRVAIHFPSSQWAPFAMIEAGYVHQKINRPHVAQPLFDAARNSVDEESDPAYAARLNQLIESLNPGNP